MKNAKKLFINTLVMTAASLGMNAVSMAFNVYISGKIGAEAVGIFQLVMSVYSFGLTIAISGIGLAVTRLVAEELALGRPGGVRQAVRKCLLYAVFFGLLAGALLFFGAEFAGKFWLRSELTVKPLRLLGLTLPLVSLTSVLNGYFTAVRQVVKTTALQLFKQFVEISSVIYLLNFFISGGLERACIAIVLGGAVAQASGLFVNFLMYIIDCRRYGKTGSGDKTLGKRAVAIAMPVALSSYLRSALNTMKHVITPIFLGMSGMSSKMALEQYGIIRGMVFPLIMLPSCLLSAAGSLLVPEVARFFVTKNQKSIHFTISRMFKLTLVFSIGVSGLIFGFAKELGEFFYHSAEAAGYIRIFAFLIPVMYFDEIVDGMLKGLDQQVKVVQINILDTLVTIGLICLLLPRYGIRGYVITIFVSEIFNMILSVCRLLRVSSCRLKILDWVVKPFIGAAAALFFAGFINVNLIFDMASAALFYVTVIYAVGIISYDDYKFLFKGKNKNENKFPHGKKQPAEAGQ